MQVGAGGNAGAAHIANQLPLGDGLPLGYHITGHVHVDGSKSISVIDGNVVPCATGLIGGHGDGAGPGGINGRPGGAGHIHALVIGGGSGGGGLAVAEGAGNGIAGNRLNPGGIGGGIFSLQCHFYQLFFILCGLQLPLLLGNFGHQVALQGLGFVQQSLEFALLGNQIPEDVVGLGALYLQHFLAAFQLLPGVLQVQHLLAENPLVFRHIGGGHL